MTTTIERKLLTRREAAAFLGISDRKLDELPIPRVPIGTRNVRYDRDDLLRWIETQKESAA